MNRKTKVFNSSFIVLTSEFQKRGAEIMRELLAKMVGKKIDLFCGGTSSLRGKLVKVEDGVAHLVDEDDQMFYVALERIIALSESRSGEQRAGFVVGFRK
jgi:hypothetical protein